MAPRQGGSFLKAGIPLFALTIGGWLGLSAFLQARFDMKDSRQKGVDLSAPVEKQRAKKFNIEEELQRLQTGKDGTEESYENKPIERPKHW